MPLVEWKAYQYEPPSTSELDAMFSFEGNLNIGVVCGIASNNLAIIDAESKLAFEAQLRRCEQAGIANTWVNETWRGGHILGTSEIRYEEWPTTEEVIERGTEISEQALHYLTAITHY